jgi:secreted trypsin-like serine protease
LLKRHCEESSTRQSILFHQLQQFSTKMATKLVLTQSHCVSDASLYSSSPFISAFSLQKPHSPAEVG